MRKLKSGESQFTHQTRAEPDAQPLRNGAFAKMAVRPILPRGLGAVCPQQAVFGYPNTLLAGWLVLSAGADNHMRLNRKHHCNFVLI